MAISGPFLTQVNSVFNELKGKFTPNKTLMTTIAGHLKASVDMNFINQGKDVPGGWPALAHSTVKEKMRRGKDPRKLYREGLLAASIQQGATEDEAWASTNVNYAAIHQFGGSIVQAARSELFTRNRFSKPPKKGQFKKGTTPGRGFTFKERVINIPARPFMVLTESFKDKIIAAIRSHVAG